MKALAVALLAAVLLGVGCVRTANDSSAMAVPFVKDQFASRYNVALPRLIMATRVVLARNGTAVVDNAVNNSFEYRVNERRVFVKCREIEPGVSEIVIQARTKFGGADLETARDLDKQIALQITQTR